MNPASLLRATFALLLALALASCAVAPATPPPRLVVLVVIDGLPQRQLEAYRDQLAPDGLARFLTQGIAFSEAHYNHAYTVTAAGHATLLTGAAPHRSGIIGNEWRDPASGERIYCTADPAVHYLGQPTPPRAGTSPRNLMVESLGDVLRERDARSRVIAVSGKDRGAILPAGRSGTAYMYLAASGQFASSSYYLRHYPAWVQAFNAGRPADRLLQASWQPLLPAAAYARSLADDQSWFGPRGGSLPMPMAAAGEAAPGPAFYARLLASPFADALTLDFARAALAGEQLGRDAVPDLLVISLSGHDYVNHRWSAESRLSHDHLLQLDRMLQAFLADLDASVGRDNYVAVLTSDHGFMPAPAARQARGQASGRVHGAALLAAVNAALAQRFGVAGLAASLSASALLLDRQRIADHGLERATVAAAARDALLAQAGLAAAYTGAELASGSRSGAPFFEAMRNSWHAGRSGDVQYVLQPYWMPGGAVATHGSPHRYDTHVPLLLWGPRWLGPARVATPVRMVDLAPTLARLLGVRPPAASEGRLLPIAPP